MVRRRRRGAAPPEVALARRAFREATERLDEATATLFLAVPSGRSPRLSLAEALAGFETHMAALGQAMEAWRVPAVEDVWLACREAADETVRRAVAMRLAPPPDGYEGLVPMLDELLAPLEAFSEAAGRLRALRA